MDGSEAVSSLKSFKPRHEGVTVNEMRATLQDVEAAYQRDTAAKPSDAVEAGPVGQQCAARAATSCRTCWISRCSRRPSPRRRRHWT